MLIEEKRVTALGGVIPLVRLTSEYLSRFNAPASTFISVDTLYESIPFVKKEEIRAALNQLSKIGIIRKVHADVYECFKEVSVADDEHYQLINVDDFLKIRNCSLLNYFLELLYTRNYKIEVAGKKGIIGNMSNEYICKQIGISSRSGLRYMQQLQELDIICVQKTTDENNYHHNYYCLAKDKEYLRKFLRDSNITAFKNPGDGNWRRKVSAKYNHFLSHPESYTVDEVHELYNMCVKYNEGGDVKKDLSVFKYEN